MMRPQMAYPAVICRSARRCLLLRPHILRHQFLNGWIFFFFFLFLSQQSQQQMTPQQQQFMMQQQQMRMQQQGGMGGGMNMGNFGR